MKIYKHGVASINLGGVDYYADDDGLVDIPDHLASGLFAAGWTHGKARVTEQASQAPVVMATENNLPAPTIQGNPGMATENNLPGPTANEPDGAATGDSQHAPAKSKRAAN